MTLKERTDILKDIREKLTSLIIKGDCPRLLEQNLLRTTKILNREIDKAEELLKL